MHKNKDINHFLVYTVVATQTAPEKGGCLMGNSIYHSSVIYNRLVQLNLYQFFSLSEGVV